ncbi:MAG: glycosyltransferase family 2 protein [Chitinophagaceae bacterium]
MRVSILLITYNHQQYIPDALKSILMQKNNFEIEIILLDDASTDQTFAIAAEALKDIKNVRLISNEANLGITKNYKKGFGLCTGDYVFILEGDDYWTDVYKMQRQVDFLEQHPYASMCFHPFLTQKGDSAIFDSYFKNESATPSDLFCIRDLILNEGLIGNYSVCCYRKTCLSKLPVQLYDVVSYDWMVNISIAQFGFLGRINTPMSVYRLSENASWSAKELKEKLSDTRQLIADYDRVLKYQFSDLFQQKAQMLHKQIIAIDNGSKRSLGSYIPPVFVLLIKYLLPPSLLNYIRKKVQNV